MFVFDPVTVQECIEVRCFACWEKREVSYRIVVKERK